MPGWGMAGKGSHSPLPASHPIRSHLRQHGRHWRLELTARKLSLARLHRVSFLPLHPTGTSWLSVGQSNPEQAPKPSLEGLCGWDGQAAAKNIPCLAKPWGVGVSPGVPAHRREGPPGFGTPRDRGWSSKEKPALFPSAHCLEMPSSCWTCGVVGGVPAAHHCPACALWQPAGCPIQRVPS